MHKKFIPPIKDNDLQNVINGIFNRLNDKVNSDILDCTIDRLSENTIEAIHNIIVNTTDIDENGLTPFIITFYNVIKDKLLYKQLRNELETIWYNPSPKLYIEFLKTTLHSNRIPVIKSVRECWPVGLKAGKEFIDPFYIETDAGFVLKQEIRNEVENMLENLKEDYPEYII